MSITQDPNPVALSLAELSSPTSDTLSKIKAAFGSDPGCLGIIVIKDLPPQFPELRERMFHLAHRLANAPEEVRRGLEVPETHYFFGWSHGKERMNGKLDFNKGSFYANPLLDHPEVSDSQREAHPEYYKGNVWPKDVPELKEFESTFKALGKLIYDVGIALSKACEPFVASTGSTKLSIERLISESQSNKARLLHYFPEEASSDQLEQDSLCGTHLDHSLLTGLCSAMYLASSPSDPEPRAVKAPSERAGLYIHPRQAAGQPRPEALKVSIPKDCLAFQTGEALELLTGGKLAATPHFVSGNPSGNPSGGETKDSASTTISRETFAFFLQPDVDDVVGIDGETFGDFTKRVIGRHYESGSGEPDEAES